MGSRRIAGEGSTQGKAGLGEQLCCQRQPRIGGESLARKGARRLQESQPNSSPLGRAEGEATTEAVALQASHGRRNGNDGTAPTQASLTGWDHDTW